MVLQISQNPLYNNIFCELKCLSLYFEFINFGNKALWLVTVYSMQSPHFNDNFSGFLVYTFSPIFKPIHATHTANLKACMHNNP